MRGEAVFAGHLPLVLQAHATTTLLNPPDTETLVIAGARSCPQGLATRALSLQGYAVDTVVRSGVLPRQRTSYIGASDELATLELLSQQQSGPPDLGHLPAAAQVAALTEAHQRVRAGKVGPCADKAIPGRGAAAMSTGIETDVYRRHLKRSSLVDAAIVLDRVDDALAVLLRTTPQRLIFLCPFTGEGERRILGVLARHFDLSLFVPEFAPGDARRVRFSRTPLPWAALSDATSCGSLAPRDLPSDLMGLDGAVSLTRRGLADRHGGPPLFQQDAVMADSPSSRTDNRAPPELLVDDLGDGDILQLLSGRFSPGGTAPTQPVRSDSGASAFGLLEGADDFGDGDTLALLSGKFAATATDPPPQHGQDQQPNPLGSTSPRPAGALASKRQQRQQQQQAKTPLRPAESGHDQALPDIATPQPDTDGFQALVHLVDGTLASPQSPGNAEGARFRLHERHVRRTILAFLRLLVNSKDDLAFLRATAASFPKAASLPEIVQAVQSEAKTSGLNLFPTVLSFCTRVELGGRGYQPSAASPLFPFRPHLAALCRLLRKLQEDLSDAASPTQGIVAALSKIKRFTLKSNCNLFDEQSLDDVLQWLKARAQVLIAAEETKWTTALRRLIYLEETDGIMDAQWEAEWRRDAPYSPSVYHLLVDTTALGLDSGTDRPAPSSPGQENMGPEGPRLPSPPRQATAQAMQTPPPSPPLLPSPKQPPPCLTENTPRQKTTVTRKPLGTTTSAAAAQPQALSLHPASKKRKRKGCRAAKTHNPPPARKKPRPADRAQPTLAQLWGKKK